MSSADVQTSDPLLTLRRRIDQIDSELLRLLNRRASLALEVATLKSVAQDTATYYRPDREAQLLRRLRAENAGPLEAEQVVQLFREIVSACRSLEQVLVVGYLQSGALATLRRQFGHFVTARSCADEAQLLATLARGELDLALLPEPGDGQCLSQQWLDPSLSICGLVQDPVEQPRRFLVFGRQTTEPTGTDETALLWPGCEQPPSPLPPGVQPTVTVSCRLASGDPAVYARCRGHQDDPAQSAAIRGLLSGVAGARILGSFPKLVDDC